MGGVAERMKEKVEGEKRKKTETRQTEKDGEQRRKQENKRWKHQIEWINEMEIIREG